MPGSLRTHHSFRQLSLLLFIIGLLFVFCLTLQLCPQRPQDHGSSSSQNLPPEANFCRDIHSSVEALKTVLSADYWRPSTRPPVYNEHRQAAEHRDTAILTIQALSDFTSCYIEHGREDYTRVTLRGRRARCSRTINRLFDLATTPEGYIALHHHVDKDQSSDRRIELERCYESLGTATQDNKDICLRRFFKDPKLLPTARCTDRWDLKLALLHHLASCDLGSSELQLCAARKLLHVIEDFPGCQAGSDHVVAPRKILKREDVELPSISPFTGALVRRPHPSKFVSRLSACLAKRAQLSRSIAVKEKDNGDDDDTDDDKDPQQCKEVEARERVITIVLTTVFVILGVFSTICVILQVVRRNSKSALEDASWQSHRTSIQQVNRDVFTDGSIPEVEEEDENDDTTPTSEISHTRRWYDRLFRKSENDVNQENQPSQEKGRNLKRRTPPDDVENVFIMPPAPNSRVRKKVPSTRMPLRPINDNINDDARGNRVTSTGSAHETTEKLGVRKSIRISNERSKKRPRL